MIRHLKIKSTKTLSDKFYEKRASNDKYTILYVLIIQFDIDFLVQNFKLFPKVHVFFL